MKNLKNWDNTWLSSKEYILSFYKFLGRNIKIDKDTKILDIGCGRANIISFLHRKYNFRNRPIGTDIQKNKDIKKNIIFIKTDALRYLKKTNIKFDLILIKQTIHFFTKKRLNSLLYTAKKRLNKNGKILIFSLKANNNQIPCFNKMRLLLNKSLKKDKILFKIIKKNLKKIKQNNFNFQVNVSKKKYLSMIKNRYISCLLNLPKKEIDEGIDEIKFNFPNQIKFIDTLQCTSFRK